MLHDSFENIHVIILFGYYTFLYNLNSGNNTFQYNLTTGNNTFRYILTSNNNIFVTI